MSDIALPIERPDRLARDVVTPEGVAVHVQLASVGERVAALMLDLLILLVSMAIVLLATFFAGGHFGRAAGIVLVFVLRAFYFTGFELAWNGRTPGKRMTSLRVVNRRGGPLAPSAVIGRNLMRELELFLPLSLAFSGASVLESGVWTWVATVVWVGALAALPLFNKDRLRAGDMVAGTWVVREPRPVLLPDLAARSTGGEAIDMEYRFTEPQLVVYGVKELQTLEEVLRASGKDAVDLQRDVAGRIARKIGYVVPAGGILDAGKFLAAFYAAQRRRLETELAFGRRRRDKFDR